METEDIEDIDLKRGTASSRKRVLEGDVDVQEKETQIDLYNERYDQDTKWRDKLAGWVVILCSVWVAVVLLLVILHGFQVWRFHLNDSVLIALLSSATTSVIGLPLVVLKGLFHNLDKDTK